MWKYSDIEKALGDSSRRTAEVAAMAAVKDPVLFRQVFDLCFIAPYPVSMRAARVIQFCCEAEPDVFRPFFIEALEKFPESKNEGVRRSFLKICSENIDLKLVPEPGRLINYCFERLVDKKEPYAIRIYSMELLYKFCLIEPELKSELKSTIEFIIDEAPASIRSRGRRILKLICNQVNNHF